MGCCCSCRRTSKIPDNIRVVDINGYVQDFDYPIIVRQLTASKSTRNTRPSTDYNYNHNHNTSAQLFVSTAEKLLSSTGSKQLGPETQLHPGHVYFLLPFSALSESLTPMDYVGLVTKLNSVAKNAPKNCIYDLNNSVIISVNNNNNNNNNINGLVRQQTQKRSSRRYGRNQTWKPILATIRERSFNRRSESDVLRRSEEDIDQTEDLIN